MSDDWKLKKADELDPLAVDLFRDIRREYHADLAGYAIALLFVPKPKTSNGNIVVGEAHVLSGRTRFLSGLHGTITLAWEWWQEATTAQQQALIDHELSHFEADDEHERLRIRGHDVEEFIEIMARHGAWHDGLKYAQGALQQRLPGMEDPDDDDGAGTSVTIEALGRKVELGTHPEAMQKLKRAAERVAVGAGG
jgi:hypothetical protein